MAAVAGIRSAHATLSGTTADTVTLSGSGDWYYISNGDAAKPLYVRFDGVTAVGAADETYVILPNQGRWLPKPNGAATVSVVGDSNLYGVELHDVRP